MTHRSRFDAFQGELYSKILGQKESLDDICALLRRAMLGFRYPDEPVASILALGPTGTGKTDTALLIARSLIGHEPIRLDMSEFMLPSAISKLIGERGKMGILGNYCQGWTGDGFGIILFDEIEKADTLVLDVFLQILSAARVTLGNGQTLNLCNFIIFATSNIGSRVLLESQTSDYDTIRKRSLAEARANVRPEILGRFNLVATFNKISDEVVFAIAARHLSEAVEIANGIGHTLKYDTSVTRFVAENSESEYYGARDIRKAAMRIVGDAVMEQISLTESQHITGMLTIDKPRNKCLISRE